ncbi:MAG TPA: META domain-containing protein [Phycisphaerales bacterium]|nr:META domain-containing protein [Phycisphaerales bacterium]HMP38531.1 META domain-containing protein [Phycisphaerales bacterium]
MTMSVRSVALSTIALAALIAAASGCDAPSRATDLYGTWMLDELPEGSLAFVPRSGDTRPWVRFEAPESEADGVGRIVGWGGVNSFFGPYRTGKGMLAIGSLGVTKVAGPPALMNTERIFIGAVQTAQEWTIEDGALVLRGEAGVARLARSSAAEPRRGDDEAADAEGAEGRRLGAGDADG